METSQFPEVASATLERLNQQLIRIEGGEIVLRDDRLRQVWTVALPPFLLARFPLTQELYFSITGHNPSRQRGAQHPVETVSWDDAVLFCNALSRQAGLTPCYLIGAPDEVVGFDAAADGYRLPTEAEWQYACQAGTTQVRYGELDAIAWHKGNAAGQTHAVGQKQPNAWGLYDMLGNVWEWCSDLYDTEVYGTYRVFRGGGWCDEARGCLAINRRGSHPSFRIDDLGFRLAKSL